MNESDVRRIVDEATRALRAEVDKLKSQVTNLTTKLEGMTICGTGFSGSGPNGIMFDEHQLQLAKGDKGNQGIQGEPGVDGSPATVSITSVVCNGDGSFTITAEGS